MATSPNIPFHGPAACAARSGCAELIDTSLQARNAGYFARAGIYASARRSGVSRPALVPAPVANALPVSCDKHECSSTGIKKTEHWTLVGAAAPRRNGPPRLRAAAWRSPQNSPQRATQGLKSGYLYPAIQRP